MLIPSCKTAALNAGLGKDEINKLLEIAKQAADRGGESLMNNFGRIKTIKMFNSPKQKSTQDYISGKFG